MMPAGCHHGCDVENVPYEPEWPKEWTDFDRMSFRQQCLKTGFINEINDENEPRIIILAYELNRANSDLASLRAYLNETQELGKRIVELMRSRVSILLAISNMIQALTPRPRTPLPVAALQILGLLIAFIPLMMIAVPVRLWFHWRVKRVQRKMIPLFTTWIAERQEKTRTQLRKVISDRYEYEATSDDGYESGPQSAVPRHQSTTSRYLRAEEDSDDGEGLEPVKPNKD